MPKTNLADLRAKKLSAASAARHPAVVAAATDGVTGLGQTNPNQSSGRRVTTVSLYAADRACIVAIQRAVEDAGGTRIDESKAIRLALRGVKLDGPALLGTLRALGEDDGRRKRQKTS